MQRELLVPLVQDGLSPAATYAQQCDSLAMLYAAGDAVTARIQHRIAEETGMADACAMQAFHLCARLCCLTRSYHARGL